MWTISLTDPHCSTPEILSSVVLRYIDWRFGILAFVIPAELLTLMPTFMDFRRSDLIES